MNELRRVAGYLQRTAHYRIVYGGERQTETVDHIVSHTKNGVTPAVFEPMVPYTFTDSSHGGERPMAGQVTFVNGSPIDWKSYRPKLTAISVTQGELDAAVQGTLVNMSITDVVQFMTKVTISVPRFLFCDNSATVMLSENNKSSKKMKHIATRIAFLQEAVKAKHILLTHIGTAGQLADIFTKPLAAAQFHELREFLLR